MRCEISATSSGAPRRERRVASGDDQAAARARRLTLMPRSLCAALLSARNQRDAQVFGSVGTRIQVLESTTPSDRR
jgi:hypothetical protein